MVMPDERWSPPRNDARSGVGGAVAGFLGASALLLFATLAAVTVGWDLWLRAFGVLQLGVLGPTTALVVWAGAPRRVVVGIFVAAALAFVVNAAGWALWPVGASLP